MASEQKTFRFDEVSKHNEYDDIWLIVSGKVYDVSNFLLEHPGGAEAMIAATNKDATGDFEEAGHKDETREMMQKFCVGKIDESTLPSRRRHNVSTTNKISSLDPTRELMVKILKFLVPFMVLGLTFTVLQ
ncbi:putative cytochrome b5-like heme/steroid binding domain, cytochrome b5, heme-binding protein [Helianthus anomalus]